MPAAFQTTLAPTSDAHPTAAGSLASALRALREDRLVAFPTETVWGLAAPARSTRALRVLRDWKGRDADQPVSVLVPDSVCARTLTVAWPPAAARLVEAFWPGPLTLVVAGRAGLAEGVARADGAIGLRCSSHPVAVALVRAAFDAGLGPLTATSLNRHGEPPAQTEAAARVLCRGGVDAPEMLAVPGDDAHGAPPTTVLDCTVDPPRILRGGALSARALGEVAGVEIAEAE